MRAVTECPHFHLRRATGIGENKLARNFLQIISWKRLQHTLLNKFAATPLRSLQKLEYFGVWEGPSETENHGIFAQILRWFRGGLYEWDLISLCSVGRVSSRVPPNESRSIA